MACLERGIMRAPPGYRVSTHTAVLSATELPLPVFTGGPLGGTVAEARVDRGRTGGVTSSVPPDAQARAVDASRIPGGNPSHGVLLAWDLTLEGKSSSRLDASPMRTTTASRRLPRSRPLSPRGRVMRCRADAELFPGIRALATPGHTCCVVERQGRQPRSWGASSTRRMLARHDEDSIRPQLREAMSEAAAKGARVAALHGIGRVWRRNRASSGHPCTPVIRAERPFIRSGAHVRSLVRGCWQ